MATVTTKYNTRASLVPIPSIVGPENNWETENQPTPSLLKKVLGFEGRNYNFSSKRLASIPFKIGPTT